jgi:hypothetical protein
MIKISTRLVLILPKIVIKIPIDKRGYLQGKNESKLYKIYKHTNLLGKLIIEFCGIVIMKKYKVANEVCEKDVSNIKKTISELNIDNCDLYNPKNWAENNLLIDYGINDYISKLY